jgi:hypothetical protein
MDTSSRPPLTDSLSKDSRPSLPGPVNLRGEGTDDDSDLIALGKQFEELAANVRSLCNSRTSDDYLELLEAALGRLEPIELAIIATPARTISGLGVKARHVAYILSEYCEVDPGFGTGGIVGI